MPRKAAAVARAVWQWAAGAEFVHRELTLPPHLEVAVWPVEMVWTLSVAYHCHSPRDSPCATSRGIGSDDDGNAADACLPTVGGLLAYRWWPACLLLVAPRRV